MIYLFLSMPLQGFSAQSGGTSTTATQQAPVPMDPRMQEFRALQAMTSPILFARYPDIMQMLFQTPSLSFQEKQYWIRLLPLMTLDQVQKLRDILITERTKLIDIQQRYASAGPATVGQVQQRKIEEVQAKKQMIKKQEMVDQQIEEHHEDALLEELDKVV
jgi:hypothetical protein